MEGYETVAKYLEKLADLKKYGFSEEETEVDIKEKEGEIMAKIHPRLFQILKDFFDNEFELPEFYAAMKDIMGFKEDGIIIIEGRAKSCYAPTIMEMLVSQLFNKFASERKSEQENKLAEINNVIKKLVSRTEIGLLPCIEKIRRINCYYSHGFYTIDIKCKKLKKVMKSNSLLEAYDQITEIEHLITPFSIKHASSLTEKKKRGYRVVYKITGLTIEFALAQSEAEQANLVERGIESAIIPLMQKFSKIKINDSK